MMTATKLADLQKEGQKHVADARAIAEKAGDSPSGWSEEDQKLYNEAMAKGTETLEKIKTAKADLEILGSSKALADEIGIPADGGPLQPVRKSLGELVTTSPEFKAMLAGFPDGRIPSKSRVQSSPINVKSLFTGLSSTSGGAFVVNERTDIVEMLGRKELTIRNLVANRRTGSDTVEFVQETSHTNNAGVVAEATSSAAPALPALDGNSLGAGAALINNAGGGYKPEGAWAFAVVQAVVKTIAEWVPVTKRAMADVAQLEGLINDELTRDVAEAEENQILNGNGSGENFTGLNNTSGIQTQAWATDFIVTTRKAVTLAKTVGRVTPTGWVFNPADAEALDLLKDGNDRYYYGGPQNIGPRTLWGYPVVESESQPSGTGLLGDFTRAVLWDREQTTVTMSDSHADFFVRNLVAVLAEERLAFGVTRPNAFVSVDLTSG